MKYLLEAKIFHCPADLSLIINEMLEELVYLITFCCVTVLLKSSKSFKFFFFACLGSGHDIHVQEGAQGGAEKCALTSITQ